MVEGHTTQPAIHGCYGLVFRACFQKLGFTVATAKGANDPGVIGAQAGSIFSLEIQAVIRSEGQPSVVAVAGSLIADQNSNLNRICCFGSVVQQGGTKTMIRHIALQRACSQQRDQPQGLQQIRLTGTIWADQQGEPAGFQNNILQGAEAGNVDLLNAVGASILR